MQHGINFREEQPNLSYVVELTGTADFDFEQKFVAILKQEFTWELGKYLHHINQEEPRAAAERVHKLKYKIKVLGMIQAFELAELHQEKLQIGDMGLDPNFKKILKNIDNFLKSAGTDMKNDFIG